MQKKKTEQTLKLDLTRQNLLSKNAFSSGIGFGKLDMFWILWQCDNKYK